MEQIILTMERAVGFVGNNTDEELWKVVDSSGEVYFTGSYEQCRDWISPHNTEFTTTGRNVKVKYD